MPRVARMWSESTTQETPATKQRDSPVLDEQQGSKPGAGLGVGPELSREYADLPQSASKAESPSPPPPPPRPSSWRVPPVAEKEEAAEDAAREVVQAADRLHRALTGADAAEAEEHRIRRTMEEEADLERREASLACVCLSLLAHFWNAVL